MSFKAPYLTSVISTLALVSCAPASRAPTINESGTLALDKSRGNQSAAYDWLNVILEASAREVDRVGARPTILSRQMAICTTAMYDAWTLYDHQAVGTQLDRHLRRPPDERTLNNKETAIGYAAYRAMLDQFPTDAEWITEQARERGINPNNTATDPTTPPGVGNLAAKLVTENRHHDGANQLGTRVGSNGTPYSDYTYYRPVNRPSPGPIRDPDRWQEIPFDDGKGGKIVVPFLTPHWYLVRPFALRRSDQFRPGPPPKVGTTQMKKEVDECIRVNASLTVQQKAIVEFMRDGPRSTGQSGHWLRFAQAVSRRDSNDLDTDVKLFFAIGNTAFDAFIACWDSKRHYDSARPWSLVRHYYPGKKLKAWAGPGKGVKEIPAEDWHPYSPATFVTPPFPGYTSGHSTVSAACARMLEHFTGSDRFQNVEQRIAGSLTEPGFQCSVMQMVNGKPDQRLHDHESCAVTLSMPTFSTTAQMAAMSRLWGGYHIRTDNDAGLVQGRKVADFIWPRIRGCFDGTAQE